MKQYFFISIFLIFSELLYGQIGFQGAYKKFTANGWYDFLRRENAVNVGSLGGYAVGIDYWFRLKKKRIEFLPEISYEKYGEAWGGAEYEHEIIGFYFKTNIYPFDFGSDCDCPTWSKDGNLFTKGFFLQLSPGVWRLKNSIVSETTIEDDDVNWTIGAGAGLDVGVSDFLTLTPIVKFYYSPGHTWKNLPDVRGEPVEITSSIQQLYAGIRLGFRWQQEGRPTRRR